MIGNHGGLVEFFHAFSSSSKAYSQIKEMAGESDLPIVKLF